MHPHFPSLLSYLRPHASIFPYCDLHSSVRRAVSKRTFAVSKRTFAVSERIVFPRDMSCLGDEIDMFSWLKRNVWLLYTIFTI